MVRLRFVVLLVCAAASLGATPLFVTGDLIWATYQDSRLFEITPGTTSQNLSGATPFQTLNGMQIGQMAFSADATTAYMTVYGQNRVVAISNTGEVRTVATGITSPTGIIRTSSGKLLVSSWDTGKIYDITGANGESFASAQAWAWGLSSPRNLLETPNGIYVSEQYGNSITRITDAAGDQTLTPAFAKLNEPVALAWYNNRLYATSNTLQQVFDVTAGGQINMAQSNAYAYNQAFSSLVVSGDKLYAGTNSATKAGSGIWDISSPTVKNYSGLSRAVAYNLPTSGDSLLAVVPAAQIVQPPPPTTIDTPEPSTFAVGLALLFGGVAMRRRMAGN